MMQFFGIKIGRTKALPTLSAVPRAGSWGGGWWGTVLEPFAGAWQKNITLESTQNILAFSAVYACISLISGDIAKLRIKLVEFVDGIWQEVAASPFLVILRKPNNYQTRIQFIEQWIVSKLIYGNTYVLKEREDLRGLVTALHILDPRLVLPLVAPNGDVYYQLGADPLAGLQEGKPAIPASEIIHDRMLCLWHPLVGVSPIYACGATTTQGIRIQANSAKFFENMSRPSGHLTSPGVISDVTAERMKREFETKFGGGNIGRTLVTGDGLKYEPMTIPADQMQLIEQLRWTIEDVARSFHMPLHKLSMGQPTLNNIGALNQDYYSQCLQVFIEAIELLLDEGLGLVDVPGKILGTEMDLDGLLRMDPLSRADKNEKAIRAGYLKPNEARRSEDMPPVVGGDTPFLQQQNYSLSALAKRDAQADPFGTAKPPPEPKPEQPPPDAGEKDALIAELKATLAMRDVIETARKGLVHAGR